LGPDCHSGHSDGHGHFHCSFRECARPLVLEQLLFQAATNEQPKQLAARHAAALQTLPETDAFQLQCNAMHLWIAGCSSASPRIRPQGHMAGILKWKMKM